MTDYTAWTPESAPGFGLGIGYSQTHRQIFENGGVGVQIVCEVSSWRSGDMLPQEYFLTKCPRGNLGHLCMCNFVYRSQNLITNFLSPFCKYFGRNNLQILSTLCNFSFIVHVY